VPCKRKTGTKTMQIAIVDNTVDYATSPQPNHDRLRQPVRPHQVADVFESPPFVVDEISNRRARSRRDSSCSTVWPPLVLIITAVIVASGIVAKMIAFIRQFAVGTAGHHAVQSPPPSPRRIRTLFHDNALTNPTDRRRLDVERPRIVLRMSGRASRRLHDASVRSSTSLLTRSRSGTDPSTLDELGESVTRPWTLAMSSD